MSEVTSRSSASRGRGSGRGGRGGFAGRGGRRPNGDKADHKADESLGAFDDEGGDIGELRKQYGDKTSVIREMFPDWSEVDVLFALQETNGDENEAVTRIAEGAISQWGEVSKPKKTSRTKPAPAPSNADVSSTGPRAARGGRTVSEGGRGRGRAPERGGRTARGRSSAAAPTNGARNKENHQLSVPTEESSAWDSGNTKAEVVEEKETTPEQAISAPTETPKPAAPPAKTWASMLRQSTAPKAPPPKPKEAPVSKPVPAPAPEPVEPESAPEPVEPEPQPEPVPIEPETETTPVVETTTPVPVAVIEPEVALPPSKDELTETNLEQVVDDSKPPPTGTAASTAADSWDPRQNAASLTATPISAAQQQHAQRSDLSGFATSAAKATAERTTRTPTHHHHQRRVLDQEEAVRMPGNREVDRAAVQFGAFNLTEGEDDIDGDREEPETRAQPPADSPKPITATVPPIAALSTPTAAASQAAAPTQPAVPNPQQFGRFGQTGGAQDASTAPQKPLDPFTQQSTPSSQPPFDNYPAQTTQPQQPGGTFSSAPSDYASYYTANDRNAYNYYGQQYGQQGAQGHQEAPSQRPFGGYGASQTDNLSQYPQSGLHNQPRFGATTNDAQNSGTSTPNPPTQAQQPPPQGQQPSQQPAQQQGQQQQQPGAQGSQPHGQQYPGYNHPYYSNPYYHQYYSGYGHSGFGGPYGKAGMYGQPYGVSPNAPYDHSSSPAAFGQSSLHRDSGLGGSGLGEYGRAATTQAGSQPGLGASSFGSVHDSFARGASSFQSQGQSFNSQAQPNAAASSDDLKPFGDPKASSGPSPSIGGARPGSATNNAPAAQGGLPPPQNSQMGGYGGYPSQLQGGHGLHGSNAYGMGGNAGNSQHGNSPYGSYNQGFGSGGYYGNHQQQQQQQQQRGGWGGNYH
ncbi:hypothetical protein BGZ63DRAFT_420532 [Mariannaea sp. PMI_226]|nr:hypothetical protein BGZ63DRAFT_420532 [Mariannaea sp. PMI_226]